MDFNIKILSILLMVLSMYMLPSNCVEVHFEAADSGFFLKHAKQPPVAPEISNLQPSQATSNLATKKSYDSVLSVDRFTVVQTMQPVSIRASYGPFSTKQTVPARYIVPDAVESKSDYLNNTTAALMELQQSNMHLDISAHLVRSIVPQDSPVLRVLFHAGADPGGHLQRQKICVLLHVSMGSHIPLKGRCIPEGEDGVCVAEVVIPSSWWPALPPPVKDQQSHPLPLKVPQRFVQVSYSVFEPPLRNPEQCEPKVQIQPLTTLAQVPLVPAISEFKDYSADEMLTVLIPQYNLYPMSKIHVPVFLHLPQEQRISAFTMKARVKSGIRILGATASSDLWNVSIEKENQKHTTARVTVFRKELESNDEGLFESDTASSANKSAIEIFSWLLEIADDSKNAADGGKIVWSITYVFDNAKAKDSSQEITSTTDDTKRKLVLKLDINKDDIQAVLPMAKNWELMNTAVLTGRQVAQAMKVFIVSQAGKVADVTLQSSCHAEDESVIKVSSSCSSVYVDGSEIRGSSNASVIVKYGTYIGLAKFIVWMPEFPLEVYISDFRLSQIKGWKVLDDNSYMHKQIRRRKKRSYIWGTHSSNYFNSMNGDKLSCKARYQQSPVEVYARFLAIDQNSGRISYFISRRTALRVTDLVQPLLRVADPKIATLKGRVLQGKSMGRTDVQVLSPITGRVIGAKEVRVGSDKVSVTKLLVNVVSGLQLTISPDNSIENGYISETSVTHKLTAQYQEGLLDIDLEFSDGSKTPLRDIAVEDYFLLVESLDTEVVAFAPMLASHHPRVIAVGEGNGNLLRVTLLLSEDCRTRRNGPVMTGAIGTSPKQGKTNATPLASVLASVEVDFDNADSVQNNKQDSVQNDGVLGRERSKGYRNNGDLADIIVGIPLRDAGQPHDNLPPGRQHRGSIHGVDKLLRHSSKGVYNDMTSMEVGMYVLLTAFCFAIIVFVISCVVYASKFRPITIESGVDGLDTPKKGFNNGLLRDVRFPKETTTNAHDWVWLGRSTMDRSSTVSEQQANGNYTSARDARIRITSNPLISHPVDNPERCVAASQNEVTSFEKHSNNQKHLRSMRPNAMILEEATSCPPIVNGIQRKPTEYRPPVPPHRNIGVRTHNPFDKPLTPNGDFNSAHANHNQHKRNKSMSPGCVTKNNFYMKDGTQTSSMIQDYRPRECNPKLLKPSSQQHQQLLQKQHQHAADEVFSPEEISQQNMEMSHLESKDQKELHNAERLIESMHNHQKNVFQFDTMTPKKNRLPKSIDDKTEENERNKSDTSSDDTGGFTSSKPSGIVAPRKSRIKRATVVGNPMFSTTVDGDIGPGESLGLDDLDMDYEQIMKYFDNLKESNA